jgi:hypothetical protein
MFDNKVEKHKLRNECKTKIKKENRPDFSAASVKL